MCQLNMQRSTLHQRYMFSVLIAYVQVSKSQRPIKSNIVSFRMKQKGNVNVWHYIDARATWTSMNVDDSGQLATHIFWLLQRLSAEMHACIYAYRIPENWARGKDTWVWQTRQIYGVIDSPLFLWDPSHIICRRESATAASLPVLHATDRPIHRRRRLVYKAGTC